MAKLTLTDILSGYATAAAYNANNALIEAALENTLSRDGTTPNTMSANLDLDSNDLNNVNVLNATGVITTSLTLNGQAVSLSTTLTGGLNASEVTYGAKALDTALDADFGLIAGAETISGVWTFSAKPIMSAGLNISASDLDIAAGDINLTGNLVVSGLVDGIDVAALSATATGLQPQTAEYTTAAVSDGGGTITLLSNSDKIIYTKFPADQLGYSLVHVQGSLHVIAVSSPMGEIRVNLPFPTAQMALQSAAQDYYVPVYLSNLIGAEDLWGKGFMADDTSHENFIRISGQSVFNQSDIDIADEVQSGSVISFNFQYYTDA